jgi:hypothetical protein
LGNFSPFSSGQFGRSCFPALRAAPIRRTTSSCFDSIDRVYVETPIPTHPKAGDLHFVSQTVNRRRMYAQIFRDFLNGQNLRRGWGDAELL